MMMIDNNIQEPEPLVVPVALLPGDTCDKCGPGTEALVAVMLRKGKLTFCRHHYRRYEAALAPLILGIAQ